MKKLLALILVIVGTFSLNACSKDEAPTPTFVTPPAVETTVEIDTTMPTAAPTITEDVTIPSELLPIVIEELKENPSKEIEGFKLLDNGTLTYKEVEVFNIHTQSENFQIIGSTQTVAYTLKTTKYYDGTGNVVVILSLISEYSFGEIVDAHQLEGEYVGYSKAEGFLFLYLNKVVAFNENTKKFKYLGPDVSSVIAPSYDDNTATEPIFIMTDGSKKIFKPTTIHPNGTFVDYVE